LFEHIPGNIVFGRDKDNDMGNAKASEAAFAKAAARCHLGIVNNVSWSTR
jgi:hypothetical protein